MDNVFISVTKEERHKVLVSDRGPCVVSVASWQMMTSPHTRSCLFLLIKIFIKEGTLVLQILQMYRIN